MEGDRTEHVSGNTRKFSNKWGKRVRECFRGMCTMGLYIYICVQRGIAFITRDVVQWYMHTTCPTAVYPLWLLGVLLSTLNTFIKAYVRGLYGAFEGKSACMYSSAGRTQSTWHEKPKTSLWWNWDLYRLIHIGYAEVNPVPFRGTFCKMLPQGSRQRPERARHNSTTLIHYTCRVALKPTQTIAHRKHHGKFSLHVLTFHLELQNYKICQTYSPFATWLFHKLLRMYAVKISSFDYGKLMLIGLYVTWRIGFQPI